MYRNDMLIHRTDLTYILWITGDQPYGDIYIRRVLDDGITFDPSYPPRRIMTDDQPEDDSVAEGGTDRLTYSRGQIAMR